MKRPSHIPSRSENLAAIKKEIILKHTPKHKKRKVHFKKPNSPLKSTLFKDFTQSSRNQNTKTHFTIDASHDPFVTTGVVESSFNTPLEAFNSIQQNKRNFEEASKRVKIKVSQHLQKKREVVQF